MSRYQRPRAHRAVLAVNMVVVALFVVLGGGILYTGQRLAGRQVVTIDEDVATAPIDSALTPEGEWNLEAGDLDARNFLVTGSDNGDCIDPDSRFAGAFGDRSRFGERTDTVMMIRVYPRDNQAAFLSFPRDLWVSIANSTRKDRINTAFDRTNPSRLIETIYRNFGIKTDHYVNIDFCAFKEIVDAVGGVRIPFAFPTRDRTTGLAVPNPSCFNFAGDHALAYVRSRSGYQYYDATKGSWVRDPTGDLGRISRQQDFIRRAMQRAIDRGSVSPIVANDLLGAALRNVITDKNVTPSAMLQLAQAMRQLNTRGIPSFTVDAYPERIGDQSVLIPRLQNQTMREILALFQGKASYTATRPSTADDASGVNATGVALRVAPESTTTTTVAPAPTTTLPTVSPTQNTLGVVPPDDPTCR